MILVDTGPWVALFDPKDALHERCRAVFREIREKIYTTVPVMTEAFYMLSPESMGSQNLRKFILQGTATMWFMDWAAIERSFELMDKYADRPMDLADASLVVAAETLGTRKVFTLDHADFSTYRIRVGHRFERVDILA